MLVTRILFTAVLLAQVGCIEFALPGGNKPRTAQTPEDKRNTEPSNNLLHSDTDVVGSKAVIGKEPPNRLLAQDGTTCIVPADKYDRIAIGASSLCIWSKTGR